MKYGVLKITPHMPEYCDHQNALFNIGDYIQTYVARKLYLELWEIKEEDIVEIRQDELKTYKGEKVFLPMQIGLNPNTVDSIFPISKDIIPIWWGINIILDIFKDKHELISEFKRYEPIACRDEKTKKILSSYGIKGYVVGCLTITMKKVLQKGNKIYLVDVPSEIYNVIPKEMTDNVTSISHEIPIKKYPIDNKEYNRLADESIKIYTEYINTAKLIVTSRLHAASPAIAMGIPVILVCKNTDSRFEWIDKYLPIYQYGEYNKINWSGTVIEIEKIKDLIKKAYKLYFTERDNVYMKEIDCWYSNRSKCEYNKELKNCIKEIDYEGNSYIIYGGGIHAYMIYEVISELKPTWKLKAIIDRYSEQKQLLGVPVKRPDSLAEYKDSYCIISTYSGRHEAKENVEKLGWKENINYIKCYSKPDK